ncbi:TIGR03943 family protein [Nocardia sp. NBC_00881]|uniref:TIGR03943 family putative permease subunit n=1 Tax=Nocardia sp. NBC_00881 TaxID=2975995 RepID=UPI0038632FAC|nr:TIGR03943 family protein [Nocardia sp. NBC_00881]
MKRETQNLLLLLIGGAVLWIALDGRYLNYVKPSLYPFLVISGIGFVVLALVAIVRDIRRGAAPANHEHGTGRAQWLLLGPVAALLLIAPPALGAGAAVTSSPVQVVPRDSAADEPKQWPFPPLPPGAAPNLPILDLVNRALQDSNHSLDSREVTISGFVLRPKALEQQRTDTPDVDLARVVITCCVADARYVLVHLAGMPELIEDDAWLEVRGVVDPDSARRDPDLTPTIVVTSYQRIPAPDRRYEHGR